MTAVVYGDGKATFVVERCGGATGSHVTGSDVTGSHVIPVTGRGSVRKYVLRMPGFFSPFFLSSRTQCSTVVPWLPK